MWKSRQNYLICFVATAVCCLIPLLLPVYGQDFGFPEETGLQKERQNANVSGVTFYVNRASQIAYQNIIQQLK